MTTNPKFCTRCGAGIGVGLNFCISCGTKIKQVPIQPTSPESSVIVSGAPETCSGCGKSLAGSLSSCTSCGTTTDPSIEPGFGETSIEELDDSVPATSEAGIDWSGIWRTLFSENSMASILGFGILLITVGLLVVLIDQWQNEESRTWLVFLALAQTAAFIFIGHMVKERLKLYLSGLAFLSLGGVWAIYTAGIISYLLFDPVTEYPQIPGIEFQINLVPLGWLVITAIPLPVWAYLAYRYRGHVLTHGTVFLAGSSVSLGIASVSGDWSLWRWAIAILPLYSLLMLLTWKAFGGSSGPRNTRVFVWTSRFPAVAAIVALLIDSAGNPEGSYLPLSFSLIAASAYAVQSLRYSQGWWYEYLAAVSFPLGVVLAYMDIFDFSAESTSVPVALLAACYIGLSPRIRSGEPRDRNPLLWVGNALAVLSILSALSSDQTWVRAAVLFTGGVYFGALGITGGTRFLPLPVVSKELTRILSISSLVISALSFIGLLVLIENVLFLSVLLWLVTFVFGITFVVRRQWYWLYPTVIAAHLALIFTYFVPELNLSIHMSGLVLTLFTIIYAGFLSFAYPRVHDSSKVLLRVVDERLSPLLALVCIDLVVSLALAGWNDWGNWEGLTASAIYTVVSIGAVVITRNPLIPYVSLFLLAVTTMFAVGMLGGSWSGRAVSWATQGLVSWWLAVGIQKVTNRKSNELLEIWKEPLFQMSSRLAIVSAVFAGIAFILSVIDASGAPGAHVVNATAVIAILGLLYLGIAIKERRPDYGYMSAAALLFCWYVQAINQSFSGIHYYAIPAGVYLLGIAYFEYRRPSRIRPLAFAINVLAVVILPVSAFIQSITETPELPFVLLTAGEAVLLTLWGVFSRSRVNFAGGIIAFTINLLYQLTKLLADVHGALIAIGIGVFLIVVVLILERLRTRLSQSDNKWVDRIEAWNW